MNDSDDPVTEAEAADMRQLLTPLYGPKVAGWQITRRHYELLGTLIAESRSCTKAMHWVPRPYDFGNPLNYARRQVRQAITRALKDDPKKSYITCTKTAARNFASDFEMAGNPDL